MTGREGQLELHECHPRSLTRNLAPDLRFNSKWCLLLTHDAHQQLTDKQKRIWFRNQVQGANAGIFVAMWVTKRVDVERSINGPAFMPREVWELYRLTRNT